MAEKDTQNKVDDGNWILLYRQLTEHWVWDDKPYSKGQAWVDILLGCNHDEGKVNVKDKIIICKRGESVKCLKTWANRWGWTKSKVSRFLKLLISDSMIELKPEQNTTHLKVLNYGVYQAKRITDETQTKHKRNANETQTALNNNDKKDNNENNEKKEARETPTPKVKKDVKHKHGEYNHVRLTEKQYDKLIEDFGKDELLLAIKVVDEYMEKSGRKPYANYNLVIRDWGIERAKKKMGSKVQSWTELEKKFGVTQ